MARYILKASFALCVLSAVLAMITRACAALGIVSVIFVNHPNPIGYHAFMDGVLLFFMLTVASAAYVFVEKRIT